MRPARLRNASQRYLAWVVSLGALLFVVAVGYASDRVLREQITSASQRSATRSAELLGYSAYAPELFTHRHGEPSSLGRALDASTRPALRRGAILDAVIWGRDGRVLYADRGAYRGRRYPLPEIVRRAFAGRSQTQLTRIPRPPTNLEAKRIAVAMPLRAMPSRRPAAVLQLDVPYAAVAADISDRARRLDLVVIGAAVVLYLVMLPPLLRAGRLARQQHDPVRERLVEDLQLAIARNELFLEFQPLIELRSGEVRSVEALVRWQHPQDGRVPPDQFIPVAESSAFFWDFSLHVLDLALSHGAELRRQGIELPVAVNLSSGNLLDPRLPDELRRLLTKHELPADAVELEVTEGAIMEEIERAAAVLGEVAKVGTGKIAIDDFGTGYSSLARVRSLPIDAIKVDRSFVREMDTTGDSALVRSIIMLAHNLGLIVIGEGIENPEIRGRLARLGCDLGQGYCIARPMPAPALVEWVRARQTGEGREETGEAERRHGPGRRNDDYFSVAFANAPEPMLIADEDGRWVDANIAACELLRMGRHEIRLRRWGAFTGSSDPERLAALWDQLGREGVIRGAWTLRDKRGDEHPINFQATANFIPGMHLFVIHGPAPSADA